MMDFATMLNRLFKKDIECRRRNLYVTVLPAKWKGSAWVGRLGWSTLLTAAVP